MTFSEGDAVEVWSKTRNRWVKGNIMSVTLSKEEGAAPGAGEVKIKLGNNSQFLDPGEFDQLRHSVTFESLPVDPEAPPVSCLCMLRRLHFTSDSGSLGARVAGEHYPQITMGSLEKLWRRCLEDDALRGSPVEQDPDLIHKRVMNSFQELRSQWCLGQDSASVSVDLCEWLHLALMRMYHPGPDAARTIAAELPAAGPQKLRQLVKRWIHIDISGTGLVSKDDLTEVLRQDFRPKLSHKMAEKMANGMLHDLDEKGLGRASYSEFVLTMLGIECTEVVLYWYDLSNDWAKYLSPLLLGSWEGGLWHTGISAFGREYFYGGRICWGPPGATVWGRPSRALRLGLTTRKLDDLREHIFMHLDKKFDRKSYDVLDRNCNHFVEEASQFLLGQSIPDEVRLQPQRLMGAPVARMFRPLLNRWLGRIEEGKDETNVDAAHSKQKKGRVSLGGA